MQFDLRIVDPPPSYGGIVIVLLLLAGTLAGLASLYARCLKRIIAGVDVAVWAGAICVGLGFGLLQDSHLVLGARLLTLACMGAGVWLSLKRSRELGILGLRTLEGAAFVVLAALASARFR